MQQLRGPACQRAAPRRRARDEGGDGREGRRTAQGGAPEGDRVQEGHGGEVSSNREGKNTKTTGFVVLRFTI